MVGQMLHLTTELHLCHKSGFLLIEFTSDVTFNVSIKISIYTGSYIQANEFTVVVV